MQLLLWDETTGKPNFANNDWHTLVIENERLIHWTVNDLKRRYAVLHALRDEDARSIASLALTNAARLFRPERGYQFTSYAIRCIRNELFREANKLLRRNERERVVDDEIVLEKATLDNVMIDGDLESEILKICREEMTRQMRVVVIAKYLRNLPIVQIAEAYNLKKSKVAKMLAEGVEVLRGKLRQFSSLT